MIPPSYGRFARYVLIVAAIVVALLGAWRVADVLLFAFGSILFAVALRAGGTGLARHLPISAGWGSLLTAAMVAALLAALLMMLGDEIAAQLQDMRRRLPDALAQARAALQGSQLGRGLLALLAEGAQGAVSLEAATRVASATLAVLSNLFIVILLAVYLSFNPKLYVDGAVKLAPLHHQQHVRTALHDSGHALRRWLLGQFVSMVSVGVLVGLGLWLVGVPNAVLLGLVAGLFEFVPVLGPLAAAVPGVLIALASGPQTAASAAFVYFAVQQLEGALIMPLAQRWAVHLPPALGLVAVVLAGVLFGVPGVLFATPLAVVIMVLVQRFYIDRRATPSAPLADAPAEAPGR